MTQDNYQNWGPWLGVPVKRTTLCAVVGCEARGAPHRCLYDGSRHHHGCIHYDSPRAEASAHGLTFREGWGLLCATHYAVLEAALAKAEGRS